MERSLKLESEKLARSWAQHDAGLLRDYLVAGVEDPRLNLQSVLSRHFLARALTGERFSALMEQEYRFAAAMNWLTGLAGRLGDAGELELVLYALRRGADNAEGIEIPGFIVQTFAALPTAAGGLTIPNYIESFLSGTRLVKGQAKLHNPSLETFRKLWHQALKAELPSSSTKPSTPSSEPACGSANDYRFLRTPTAWRGSWTTPASTSAPRTSRTPARSSRASALRSATCLRSRRRTKPSICASSMTFSSTYRWKGCKPPSKRCAGSRARAFASASSTWTRFATTRCARWMSIIGTC